MNKVILTGRITKVPELRYTPNGMATLSFSIAVDRQVRNQDGTRQADFINCVAWCQ
jgi:single-strand DNA-binding protein